MRRLMPLTDLTELTSQRQLQLADIKFFRWPILTYCTFNANKCHHFAEAASLHPGLKIGLNKYKHARTF